MRGVASALGFVVITVVIAFGAAGIVAGMDAPPTGGDRPELTQPGDAKVTPQLDAIEADLTALADQVDALGTEARGALAALAGSDLETVDGAIAQGDTLVADIQGRTAALQATFAALPIVGTPAAEYELSPAVRSRADRLRAALTTTDGLGDAWGRLTTGSVAASRLSGLLSDHVDAVLAAAELGRHASYAKAAKALDPADAALKQARTMRDTLTKTVDVTVLDQWLKRNEAYDAALRKLYTSLRDSKGKVNADVRAAIKGETAAKANLPPDDRGLIVIMSDIGRGGMNDAVITIEEARGRLADALRPPVDEGSQPVPTVAP